MGTDNIFRTRQEKLVDALRDSGLNGLVVNPGPTLVYLTGLGFHLSERPVIVTFVPDQPPSIILPELEMAKVEGLSYPLKVYPYGEMHSTWVDTFKQANVFHNFTTDKIGVEPRGLRYLELQLLQAASPRAIFTNAEHIVNDLRIVKDQDEIEQMQQAVDIAQAALNATLPSIEVGVNERDIASELFMQLVRHGSTPMNPFSPIVSGGPNSANPHASPSNRPLSPGDLLVIDFGAYVNGYFSDITRTFAIGTISPEFQKIADIVHVANRAARGAAKPGVSAESVDDAARRVIENAGYGRFFIHRTGHGLGMEVHEAPYIRKGNPLLLKPGMTFTIEPGIYIPGQNGVRIEDDIVVTQGGARSLTTLPRALSIL